MAKRQTAGLATLRVITCGNPNVDFELANLLGIIFKLGKLEVPVYLNHTCTCVSQAMADCITWLKNRQPDQYHDKQHVKMRDTTIDEILADLNGNSKGIPSEHSSTTRRRTLSFWPTIASRKSR